MLALKIAATVHISVLGSFHPVQFELQPAQGQTLAVESQGHTEILQGDRMLPLTGPAKVSGRNGAMVHFRLAAPGVAPREYIGRLEVRRSGSELLAIVEMDRETAVAAIVEAEGADGLPFEARKAQAVVTRSYLAGAHNRHQGFDFCDNEHCQLMKGIAHPTSAGSRAAFETRGQVLVYKGDIIPAMYSANCGGHTKSLAQTKWEGAAIPQPGYPYFSVACPLRGKASGHGVGMCQMGAIDIARHGYPARIILGHYFPGTTVEAVAMAAPKAAAVSRNQISAVPTVHQSHAARPVHAASATHASSTTLTASAGMGARAAQ
ncbi:MAG TPA: SpoIID/LytB domain-containing protein [Candidatus Sulfopaludibacter sp.]|nr:SpoIID/LytB domain-containing protein [Candidatus Sulfopaludibacter sp.]